MGSTNRNVANTLWVLRALSRVIRICAQTFSRSGILRIEKLTWTSEIWNKKSNEKHFSCLKSIFLTDRLKKCIIIIKINFTNWFTKSTHELSHGSKAVEIWVIIKSMRTNEWSLHIFKGCNTYPSTRKCTQCSFETAIGRRK